MRIRIEKLSEVDGGLPANDRQNHIDGQEQDNGYSLPVEYTIEGELINNISVGKSVMVNRDTRNGVKAPGMFATSIVQSVDENTFETLNSVYKFEYLEK